MPKDILTYFEQRYEPVTESGCWIWTGAEGSGGYGQATYNYKHYRAHRIAYELFVGAIPEGLFVCHHCDVTPCVNPSHLFLGTHADNMRDMLLKGRTAKPWAGKKQPNEANRKRAIAMEGNKHTLGMKHTPEAKEKIRQASVSMWAERKNGN